MDKHINLIPFPHSIIEREGFFESNNYKNHIKNNTDSSILAEGYRLEIGPTNIKISASDNAGFFYAQQTLKQLETEKNDTNTDKTVRFPNCIIEDSPAYSWRGFMIDCSRSFYPASWLEKIIDVAAFYKLNRFHWHLTDDQGWRLPIPEYPLLTEIGAWKYDRRFTDRTTKIGGYTCSRAYYTEKEIRHLVAYAAERHITVVPEIEMPGHVSALLAAYPGLGCTGGPYKVEDRYGIFDNVLCAGNDDVLKLYETIFDRVCNLFPGDWIHIGGDECPHTAWKSCNKCKKRIQDEGLQSVDQLQPWLTVKIASMLEKRRKIPIGWDEVLDGTQNMPLPKSMTVQSWRGIEGGKKAAALGHFVIMSPQYDGCYFDFKNYDDEYEPGGRATNTVYNSYNFSPVTQELTPREAKYVLGGQGNLWTEIIPSPKLAEYMLFPRLCALSEALWLSVDKKNFKSFSTSLTVHKKRLRSMDILYYDGKLE
ncbi:MAG: hypothetical protein BKP49_04375 [Treponema sp. CETP13]|nr:MAG: hypothetical protein BKP49_04375 [Treponema sp. CETP13]